MLNPADVEDVISRISYKPGWKFDYRWSDNGYLISSRFLRTDTVTGEHGWSAGTRQWHVENWRDKGYLVRTCLMAIKANEEHEVLENFKLDGKPYVSPHANYLEVV